MGYLIWMTDVGWKNLGGNFRIFSKFFFFVELEEFLLKFFEALKDGNLGN